jgi:hypothetical protein
VEGKSAMAALDDATATSTTLVVLLFTCQVIWPTVTAQAGRKGKKLIHLFLMQTSNKSRSST